MEKLGTKDLLYYLDNGNIDISYYVSMKVVKSTGFGRNYFFVRIYSVHLKYEIKDCKI